MTQLSQQLAFILEIDKLKSILRQTPITGPERRQENDAEHSWHIAVMASLLVEYAPAPIDVSRVTRMLLIHDIVEIDAGDTFAYDAAGYSDKEERERLAADRLFGLLPAAQSAELRALWDEFEAFDTSESRYANALDRLQPLLLNSRTGGGSWRNHHVTRDQVLIRMEPIRTGLPELWTTVLAIVDDASERGWLPS
ncbi:MAG TPA: HD domain-containing protein [Candidatus Saccharimonadales bacterium]|nr:HD domain-containing protein [Candidatus Saccharimonadales bacterium]